MQVINRNIHTGILSIFAALAFTSLPTQAFTLRNIRELCKAHRFKILAVATAAIGYMYTHKLIEKCIQDYKANHSKAAKATATTSGQEYAEGFADAFIKITKLVGTVFKTFRALTCPDEGKSTSDQWLDEFSQLA